MADYLRTRIAGVLGGHIEDQLTNYDAGRNECGCGQQGNATYRDHVADAVIRELDDMGIIHLSRVVGCKTGPVGHERECR